MLRKQPPANASARQQGLHLVVELPGDALAIARQLPSLRERNLCQDFAFGEEIYQMRQQGHVPPITNFIGDGAIAQSVTNGAGGDRATKSARRLQERRLAGRSAGIVDPGRSTMGRERVF